MLVKVTMATTQTGSKYRPWNSVCTGHLAIAVITGHSPLSWPPSLTGNVHSLNQEVWTRTTFLTRLSPRFSFTGSKISRILQLLVGFVSLDIYHFRNYNYGNGTYFI